jgi:hyperosmotically inducible protein
MRMITNYMITFVLIAVVIGSVVGCAGNEGRRSTGTYIDDTAITTKVKSALASDPIVSALDVDVDTSEGRVQLSGFVETEEQSERAEDIAQSIEGVRSVENDIIVK